MIKRKQQGFFNVSTLEMNLFFGFFILGGLTFLGSVGYGIYWLFNHLHFI